MSEANMTVALLFGGVSPEHEISILSAGQVAESLVRLSATRPLRVEPVYVNVEGQWVFPTLDEGAALNDAFIAGARDWELPARDVEAEVLSFENGLARLKALAVDIVFIAMHGAYGEDGRLQGALDLAGLAYTGSGAAASALALDKSRCQAVLNAAGLPVAPSALVRRDQGLEGIERLEQVVELPCVVKPSRGGSSVGVTIVRDVARLRDAVSLAIQVDDEVLVERFVAGREFTCGLIECGGDLIALPVTEIIPPEGRFFDYDAKYTGVTREVTPARVPPRFAIELQTLARAAHRALGCRGMSRVDFIGDPDGPGRTVVLEINTIPGMTAMSLLPQAARAHGIELPELLGVLLDSARHD